MHFLLFGQSRREANPLAKHIFERNGRGKRAFRRASREDFWALLMDDRDQILAECTIHAQSGLFSKHIESYYICDVFVHPPHRGNGYAVAMILNVMYELGDPTIEDDIPFYLHAYRRNRSAIRCYTKIFGEPYRYSHHLVTFISVKPRSFWPRLCMR